MIPAFTVCSRQAALFDLETPYGYGGPLTDAPLSPEAQQIFMEELRDYCLEQRIVTQFLRYHPLLDNHGAVAPMTDTHYLRDTIYMDTASPELILANMDSKNRNMVRKAQRSGVTVREAPCRNTRRFWNCTVRPWTSTARRITTPSARPTLTI